MAGIQRQATKANLSQSQEQQAYFRRPTSAVTSIMGPAGTKEMMNHGARGENPGAIEEERIDLDHGTREIKPGAIEEERIDLDHGTGEIKPGAIEEERIDLDHGTGEENPGAIEEERIDLNHGTGEIKPGNREEERIDLDHGTGEIKPGNSKERIDLDVATVITDPEVAEAGAGPAPMTPLRVQHQKYVLYYKIFTIAKKNLS